MKRDINDFITIVRQKNGHVKIKHDFNNEANIYKLLHDLGYGKSKLNNRRIYFRRYDGKIIPVNLINIKDAFEEVLKKAEFSNVPSDIGRSDILNWYYERQPIKENGLFDHYLNDPLNEVEAHNYLLLTDHTYKRRHQIQQLLSKFEEWAFRKSIDSVGTFCEDNPLYYKPVADNKYLVFNHFKPEDNENDGFDSWVATYTEEKHIGNEKPLNVEAVRLCFKIDRDIQLIKKYIN